MPSTLPQVNPDLYPQQLATKADALRQRFAAFNPPELEVFASPPSHYRLRAEFRIWHTGDDLFYAMFAVGEDPKKDRQLIRMDQYPVAGTEINRLMPLLLDAIRDQPLLRRRLFQVEFLTTLSGQALLTLIYHRQLDDAWEAAARLLQQQLGVLLIGRSRGQKRVLAQDFVLEELRVGERRLTYKQIEGGFTQPNPYIGQRMLEWVLDALRPAADEVRRDLVELYCGNGNFTLALAPNFRRVLGTEISRASVAAGQYNIAVNGISNVRIERLAAEDFATALEQPDSDSARKFELDNYDFSTVLVDPPRAGLDAATLQQLLRYERILYISCNPETLADNLQTLTRTHLIQRFAFFDQFPYTHHAECGVYLVRRQD